MKKEVKHNIYTALLVTVVLTTVYFTVNPAFTGHVILGAQDFETSNLSLFNYNEDVEILNGVISLKATETTYNWTTYSQNIISLDKAYKDPSDKMEELKFLDGEGLSINDDNIANINFNTSLDNGDIVTLYLLDKETTNIYLCPPNEECSSSSNLGFVYFPDSEGYYNITLQNLIHPSKSFNLNSDEDIKPDYITSTQGNLSGFWYDPDDETSKVSTQDSDKQDVKEDEIFDLLFQDYLEDGDILQFYLDDHDPTGVEICDSSEFCSSGLGSFNYNGSEGWFNISLSLTNPTKSISINPDTEKLKLDFANVVRVTPHHHSVTNISYPLSANITTEDLVVSDLDRWGALIVEENLSSQTINYEFSTDSGTTWTPISEDKNLSSASNSTSKIRIKAILTGNTSHTPSLSLLNLTYYTLEPSTYYDINETKTISALKDREFTINSSSLKTELNILPKERLSNVLINITEPRTFKPSNLTRLKELEINAPELNDKLNNATLRHYYDDSDLGNLKESSLKLYYYNETSESWEPLDSTVNVEENYVEATLEHFSTYGIFGDENPESPSSSSSSGGSGGSSDGRTFIRGTPANEPVEITNQPAESEEPEAQVIEPSENTQFGFTGNVVNISKILTNGSLNKILWVLGLILFISYIVIRIREKTKN